MGDCSLHFRPLSATLYLQRARRDITDPIRKSQNDIRPASPRFKPDSTVRFFCTFLHSWSIFKCLYTGERLRFHQLDFDTQQTVSRPHATVPSLPHFVAPGPKSVHVVSSRNKTAKLDLNQFVKMSYGIPTTLAELASLARFRKCCQISRFVIHPPPGRSPDRSRGVDKECWQTIVVGTRRVP